MQYFFCKFCLVPFCCTIRATNIVSAFSILPCQLQVDFNFQPNINVKTTLMKNNNKNNS